MKCTLRLEVEFPADPSPRAEQDIREAIKDLQESLAYLSPQVTRADLVRGSAVEAPDAR